MKTYIWTIPTRIFHWLLAISFASAFTLGGEDDYLPYHAALGIFIGSLILFRIIQGVWGPRYARFSDFPITPQKVIGFLKDMKGSKSQHLGHNPLAALVMLCIMITALLSAVSGALLYEVNGNSLFGTHLQVPWDDDAIGEFHEIIVHVFMILVGVHILGIVVDTIFHPEHKTIFSILTGYKKAEGAAAKNNLWQTGFSWIGLLIPFLLFFYVLSSQLKLTEEYNKTEQHDEQEHD